MMCPVNILTKSSVRKDERNHLRHDAIDIRRAAIDQPGRDRISFP